MKLFLIKVVVFFLIFALYAGGNYQWNVAATRADSSLELENCDLLILGDSYPMRALNPEYFENATNVCQGAEPYFISYWKLKLLLAKNPSIKTVLLGFSHHNLSGFNDKKLVDPRWSAEMAKRFYAIGELGSIDDLEMDWRVYFTTVFNQACLKPMSDRVHFIGGYSNSRHSDITDVKSAIQKHFFYEGENVGVSKVALRYLEKIVGLCQDRGVNLYLTNSPVRPEYLSKVPANFRAQYRRVRADLLENGIKTIRYQGGHLTRKEFLNCDHVNLYGARKFSNWVASLLEEYSRESR